MMGTLTDIRQPNSNKPNISFFKELPKICGRFLRLSRKSRGNATGISRFFDDGRREKVQ